MSEKELFIEYYFVQKLSKNDIKTKLNLSETKYNYLIRATKNVVITEITTEVLESLIIPKLNSHPDNETIRMAMEIWKYKYKLPSAPKGATTDFGALLDEEPSPAP